MTLKVKHNKSSLVLWSIFINLKHHSKTLEIFFGCPTCVIMHNGWGIPKKRADFWRRAVESMPPQSKDLFSRQEKAIFSFKIALLCSKDKSLALLLLCGRKSHMLGQNKDLHKSESNVSLNSGKVHGQVLYHTLFHISCSKKNLVSASSSLKSSDTDPEQWKKEWVFFWAEATYITNHLKFQDTPPSSIVPWQVPTFQKITVFYFQRFHVQR